MAKYILTGKSTIGHKDDNGEFHTFRKGDEVPGEIYNRLPARVQGFITVSETEEKDTLFTQDAPEASAENSPKEFVVETDSPAEEKKSSKRKKKSD